MRELQGQSSIMAAAQDNTIVAHGATADVAGGRTRAKKWIVRLVAVALMAVILPAIAATPASASTCSTSIANPERPAGSPLLPAGSFICEYGVTWHRYDSRWHVFLVGTNSTNSIYHTWQSSPTGPYGSWVSLGGTGRSSVFPLNYTNSSGGLALEIAVVGTTGQWYCKNYNGNVGGGWWPGQTTWTSNASSCRLF